MGEDDFKLKYEEPIQQIQEEHSQEQAADDIVSMWLDLGGEA